MISLFTHFGGTSVLISRTHGLAKMYFMPTKNLGIFENSYAAFDKYSKNLIYNIRLQSQYHTSLVHDISLFYVSHRASGRETLEVEMKYSLYTVTGLRCGTLYTFFCTLTNDIGQFRCSHKHYSFTNYTYLGLIQIN